MVEIREVILNLQPNSLAYSKALAKSVKGIDLPPTLYLPND